MAIHVEKSLIKLGHLVTRFKTNCESLYGRRTQGRADLIVLPSNVCLMPEENGQASFFTRRDLFILNA